jgi:hypothetical protein
MLLPVLSILESLRWRERADNVLKVESRDKRERQQMIQVCSLLMMFMYIYNGKGCNPRDTTVSEGVDQEEQP